MDGGKRSAWIKHVMKHKKAGMSLGDAMKAAKKTWKGGADVEAAGDATESVPAPLTGGQLMGKGTVAGGKRRRTRKHKGGQLYSFAGGPYTDSPLADGAARNPAFPAVQWEGANPEAASGGRRRKSRKMTKKAGRRRGSRKH